MDSDYDNHRYQPSYHKQGYGSYGSSGGNNGDPGGRYQDRDEGNGDNGGVNYGHNDSYGGNSRGGNRGAGGGRSSFSHSSNYNNYPQHQDNGQQASSKNGRYGNTYNEYYDDGSQQEHAQTRDSGGDSYSKYSARPQQHSSPEPPLSGNPAEWLKPYQQAKSDPHVVGLESSANFFHETYDKLDRTEGLADQHASTKHAVTAVRTFCEKGTQTTDDEMLTQESIWNGIRIVDVSTRSAQSQSQHAATESVSSTMPVLRPAVPPPAAVATSLLKAVTNPPASSVTSPTASAPLLAASTERPSYEREAPSGWGETNPGSRSQSYMGSAPKELSQRRPSSESSGAKNPPQPDRKDSAPVDSWSVGATAMVPATGGGWGGGWGGPASAKGVGSVGAMVDWSSGTVSEFPADVKPTAMPITAPWNARDQFAASDKAPASDQQQIADDHRSIEDEKDSQMQSTLDSRKDQAPLSNQGGGNYNSSDSSSRIAFGGRRPSETPSNSSSRDGENCGRPQQRNPYPQMLSAPPTASTVRSQQNNNGSERRPMTSEERFMNSQNRQNSTQNSSNDYDTGAGVGTPLYDGRSYASINASNSHYDNNSGGNNNSGNNNSGNSYYNNNSGGNSNSYNNNSSSGNSNSYNNNNSGGNSNSYNSNSYNNNYSGSSNNYNLSYNNRGGSASRGGSGQQGYENNSYGGGSSGGRGGPASHRWNNNSERTGPTSVLPSPPSNLTGRRYYSNNPNRESAISAWSAASQNSSKLAGNGRPTRASSSTAESAAAHYSPTGRTGGGSSTAPGASNGGGGLATANDFLSFMKAAKEFTPPPPPSGRNRSGGGIGAGGGESVGAGRESRNGSVSGSVRGSTHGSPSGSRQHSRTRQNTYEQDRDHEHEQDRDREYEHGPQHDHTHHRPPHMEQVPESERETAQDIGDQHFLANESQTDWSKQVEDEEAELERAQIKMQQGRLEAPLIPGLEGSERSIRSPPDSVTSNRSNGGRVVPSAVEDNLLSFESHEVNDDTATESKGAAATKEVEEDGENGENNQTKFTAESEAQETQHATKKEYESHPTPSTLEQQEPQNSANADV
ncbi:hypothetical protein BGZ58_009720 [Dissophora ornata]|nr:hypothetical protein BGZ58_009720 [Dissophora ornata]